MCDGEGCFERQMPTEKCQMLNEQCLLPPTGTGCSLYPMTVLSLEHFEYLFNLTS